MYRALGVKLVLCRTFYTNNRWLRRPGPWPGAGAVTVLPVTRTVASDRTVTRTVARRGTDFKFRPVSQVTDGSKHTAPGLSSLKILNYICVIWAVTRVGN